MHERTNQLSVFLCCHRLERQEIDVFKDKGRPFRVEIVFQPIIELYEFVQLHKQTGWICKLPEVLPEELQAEIGQLNSPFWSEAASNDQYLW